MRGTTEILTFEDDYTQVWDFPPRMLQWSAISPRKSRKCPVRLTSWWAMAMNGHYARQLNPDQREVRGAGTVVAADQ
ncbi:hypothetical protein SAMN04489752_2906 [Brevibacterium siliguriense]|uniref:Uncharacterized protein n=1 Tax=Brevibacterium siliguriense TaxID=1136497 RepID=A0A1H1WAZ3_9MICO|nr:hypothetical protein SAMN04489752_2906 [Brevibacterium siliguriense]